MSDKKSQDTEPQFEIRWEGKASETYSNFLVTNWTLYDVRLRFGQLVPAHNAEEKPLIHIEEKAAVTLAWNEAKVLRNQLDDAIKRYEAINGELKDPKPVL